jgi:hypothetical protein
MLIFYLHRKYENSTFIYIFDLKEEKIQVEEVTAAEANARQWWNPCALIPGRGNLVETSDGI